MPMPTAEEMQQTIAELQQEMDALQLKYETTVPKGVQRTILILGAAALLKKPWMIALAVVPYLLNKK